MKKELILVDANDKVIGYGEKFLTHKKGEMHRAFSLFIYSAKERKFFLQKRSIEKYHSGVKWSNSCCSHPYKNETWYESLQRCVSDELNTELVLSKKINCQSNMSPQFIDERLFFAGAFLYFSKYEELSEHEFDYVFIYTVDSNIPDVNFNSSEISEIKWLTLKEIDELLLKHKEEFTSWFPKAYSLAKKGISYFDSIANE